MIIQLLPISRSYSDWYLRIKKQRLIGINRALIRSDEHGSMDDLVAVGKFVAARTGWPLEHE